MIPAVLVPDTNLVGSPLYQRLRNMWEAVTCPAPALVAGRLNLIENVLVVKALSICAAANVSTDDATAQLSIAGEVEISVGGTKNCTTIDGYCFLDRGYCSRIEHH